jgi:ribonuclease P/MRP protein subunit POP1
VVNTPSPSRPKSSALSQDASTGSENRTLWIRTHPAALKSAIASLKSAHQQFSANDQLDIADLSGDVNAFELVGPRTSQVIHGAFHPVNGGREAAQVCHWITVYDAIWLTVDQFWRALGNARSPGNFSPGMVIGLTIHDPRLQ